MRLSKEEIEIIKKSVLDIDPNALIKLFGSRTDDTKLGGDIDLLLISDKLSFHDKLTILVNMKKYLGERKIDIIIFNKTDLFHNYINQDAVSL
ncbi:MAG: nucleotidyltransferase domain-containing protein [Melioribacteraceae bacterium]|nr:nucleotidyltransferase domain-containing protein [Melioribacteraceae bacterium]